MLVLLWFALLIPVMGAELEVRLYRVSEAEFQKAHQASGLKANADDFWGEVVKPEFESRFFDGEGRWRNCAKRVGEILQDKNFEGVAMVNLKRGVMVMKSTFGDHVRFAKIVRDALPKQIRFTASVYSVPGVVSGVRAMGFAERPEGADLLGEISAMAPFGRAARARAPSEKLEIQAEMTMDEINESVEVRFNLSGDLKGKSFSIISGLEGPIGMPLVQEMGSFNGKETMLLVMTPEVLLMDGSREDDWVLKEQGGTFLRKDRFRRLRQHQFVVEQGSFTSFTVPSHFLNWLNSPVDKSWSLWLSDSPVFSGTIPGLTPKGALFDLKELFRMNGIFFEKGGFVVLDEMAMKLHTNSKGGNLELMHGILKVCSQEGPRMIRVDLEKWSSDGKFLKKVGALVSPGQLAEVALGNDLKAKIAVQTDSDFRVVELRVSLTESQRDFEKAVCKTGVTLLAGVPVELQRSLGEEDSSWRVTAFVVGIGKGVDSYLRVLGR